MSKPKPKAKAAPKEAKVSTGPQDPHQMTQFYNLIKKDPEMAKLYDYPNKAAINLKLPARFLLCGPTGSGKTTTVTQIIKSYGVFERIIVIAKDTTEDLYEWLAERCAAKAAKEEVDVDSIFTISDDLAALPSHKDGFDKHQNTLVIIDDFVNSTKAQISNLITLWIMGRKKSVSMCWLTQSFFDTNKIIRQNCQYIILKKLADEDNLRRILRQYKNLNCTPEVVLKMCQIAIGENDDTTQFFMIDVLTGDPNLRYRHCWKGFTVEQQKQIQESLPKPVKKKKKKLVVPDSEPESDE